MHPDETKEQLREMRAFYGAGQTNSYMREMRLKHHDGHYIWVLVTGQFSEWDASGRPVRFFGAALDIDARKQTEIQLKMALDEISTYNKRLKSEVAAAIEDTRRANETLWVLSETSPTITVVLDRQYQLVSHNPAAEAFFGGSTLEGVRKDLVNQLREIVPVLQPDGRASKDFRKCFETALKKGSFCVDTWIYVKHTLVPIRLQLRRILYQNKPAVATYITDLSDQKQVERALRKQGDMAEISNKVASLLLSADQSEFDAVMIESMEILGRAIEADRISIYRNQVRGSSLLALQMYWLSTRNEKPREKMTQLAEMDYAITLPQWFPLLSQGLNINTTLQAAGGAEHHHLSGLGILSILVIPLMVQGDFWGFLTFEDLIRRRKFPLEEERLMTSGGILIASAIQRHDVNDSLMEATKLALESTHAKSTFLANMSHEIRTPMNAIIGMTTAARNAGDNIARIHDSLDKIESSSRLLLGIINDVLDMSKIEARRFELVKDTFSFRRMVQNVCAISSGRIQAKSLQLQVTIHDEVPDLFVGDEVRLSQVINNLLSNAAKFTPDGGTIRLEAGEHYHQRHPDGSFVSELLISVSDTGIGIAPDKLETVFEAFEQVSSDIHRMYGGTGLGLAISKNIVTEMKGHIWATSTPGKGSCFSFTVQMKRGDGTLRQVGVEKAVEDYDFSGCIFLAAEDLEINQLVLEALLEPTGAVLECAQNGQQAIELFESAPDRYNMIFMDVQMPVMGGLEATRRIRALSHPRACTIPIIAMTANAFADDIDHCRQAGMDDHLAKPLELAKMLRKIEDYL